MPLSLDGLQNLLRSANFQIEALNVPTSPGQPQVFQISPNALQFLPDASALPIPSNGPSLDIPPIPMSPIDIPTFSLTNTVPPQIDIPAFTPNPLDIPPIPLPASIQSIPSLIPTADILNVTQNVRISVDWQVEDMRGMIIDQTEAILYPGKTTNQTAGGGGFGPGDDVVVDDIVDATTGEGGQPVEELAKSLQTTVMVLPQFVDLARDFPPPPVKTLYLSATVTLSLGGIQAKLRLTRFPITVPAIPIPTLAVFFAKPNLGIGDGKLLSGDQFAFIVVPQNSPIGDVPALRAILKTLSDIMQTVDAIKTLAGLAGEVLPALDALTGSANTLLNALNLHILGSSVGVAFAVADRIADLNNIDTIKKSFFNNDIEAEDTISSLVFIAPPDRQLLCRQHDKFEGRGIRVRTGDACIAIVNNLTKAPVAVLPDPVAGLSGPTTHQSTEAPALDNRFSSMAFL